MTERNQIDQKAREFFEELWNRGDPWELDSSEFEQVKYESQIAILPDRRYGNVIEIGCGAGSFTRRLAGIADRVLALDISATAIARAEATMMKSDSVEFRVANIMDFDIRKEGPWDLVVMSETIYYLGWLYSFFDVGWLASEVFAATADGGHLLMANTCGGVEDYLLRPWLIRTYRDLFLNSGYHLKSEDMFRGKKNGTDLEVLISLFAKGSD
jgi:predicted TPR repeat methyltransferase